MATWPSEPKRCLLSFFLFFFFLFFFLFFFFDCVVELFFSFGTTVLYQWDFSHGKSSCLPRGSQLRQSRATQATVHAGCFCVSIIHQTDMDYEIFNVRTDVNACDCAWGCTDTLRESALKGDSGRKIPCHTRKTNQHRGRAGPMLYQLNYIPTKSYGLRGAGWLSV